MKLRSNCEIERIASVDGARVHISDAYLDVAKKRMCATNGHVLAVVPVEVDAHDVSGYVTGEALKTARKLHRKIGTGETMIDANGALAVPMGPTFPRPRDEGHFPPVDQVIPEFRAGSDDTITIGVNVNYLIDLARALGIGEGSRSAPIVALTFKVCKPGEAMRDPIVVTDGTGKRADDSRGVGVLMPCVVQ